MAILLLITGTICSSLQSILRREYNNKTGGGIYAFSAMAVFFAAIFFFVKGGCKIGFDGGFIGYSLLFALSYTAATVGTTIAIKIGPLGLTAVFGTMSLAISALYGILVLGEPCDFWVILGVILIIVSLSLVNYTKSGEEKKISFKWFFWVLLSALGNGMSSILQKLQQINCAPETKENFMLIALIISGAIMLTISIATERKLLAHSLKKGFLYYATTGLTNGYLNLTTILLVGLLPMAVTFPVISAGSMLITVVCSVVFYKEKLNTQQIIGVILGVGAIIALSI